MHLAVGQIQGWNHSQPPVNDNPDMYRTTCEKRLQHIIQSTPGAS